MTTLKLLGKVVDGVEQGGNPEQTHWMVKRGPYEAKVTEWSFAYSGSDSPPYRNYSYHLKVGHEYVLHSQSSVDSAETAIQIIDNALREWLREKKFVEAIYS